MVRCPHTTSRSNRRSRIRFTRSRSIPRPIAKARPDNPYADSPGDDRFPCVLTTYRLTEHHTAGGMTRTLSHLAELQPVLFCEISPELAAEVGCPTWRRTSPSSSPRGSIVARALVTARMRPLRVGGRTIHQVGLPYHWGHRGLVRGDVVNDLVAISEEPNVKIMESKALVCRIAPVRAARQHGDSHDDRPHF